MWSTDPYLYRQFIVYGFYTAEPKTIYLFSLSHNSHSHRACIRMCAIWCIIVIGVFFFFKPYYPLRWHVASRIIPDCPPPQHRSFPCTIRSCCKRDLRDSQRNLWRVLRRISILFCNVHCSCGFHRAHSSLHFNRVHKRHLDISVGQGGRQTVKLVYCLIPNKWFLAQLEILRHSLW